MDELIAKAKNYAMMKHMGQKRADGTPYIFHPLRVAQYLTLAAPDDINLICAGACHDLIEDTTVTYEELRQEFNEDIANLVREVTKEGQNRFPNLKTKRGILLKFFDRADNLSDMKVWSDKRVKKYLKSSKFWKS
jgi:GTP diphosphokinase / guanosine-3',5'-bis(diphosphate) 3'-diphosphatase